jgi:peroxiredoxin
MKFVKGAAWTAVFLSLQIASGALAAPDQLTKTTKAEGDKPTAAAPVKTEAMATPAKAEKAMDAVDLTTAPDFTLKDTEGKSHTLSEYTKAGKVVVLEWFNPDCPFVKKHHVNNKSMSATYQAAAKQGVVWLAINSGSPGKQGAGLERNVKAKTEYAISYPVLLDEAGTVGRAYGAKTTPHMFVIAKDGSVAYAGAIDNDPAAGKLGDLNYVTAALDAISAGKPVENPRTKSYGCSVKYGDVVP